VDFLEGDLDRPIIVGSVYNATNMPPYGLPSNKTQSGIKSESSQGGDGYNQIRFEDLKGKEEVFVHAQRDMNSVVENDRTLTIKNDETIQVDNNRSTKVDNDDTTKIGNKMSLTVQADRDTKIMGKDTKTVSQDSTTTIMGSEKRTVSMSRSTNISTSDTLIAGGSISITASGLTITAPTITLNAGVVQITGMVQCMNMVASVGVVSPTYTPGAGNIW
jgi:type VI secretion system secreted protein VgrG